MTTFQGMRTLDLVRNQWMSALCLGLPLILIVGLTSCGKTQNSTSEKPAQKTFASPAEAGAAFLEAAKNEDQNALLAIFGPDAKTALFSGDAVKDKNALADFVAAYN